MAVPALPQDFIGLKISIYITLSTPLIKSAFGPLFSCVVAKVVSPGGGLVLFFRDLTVNFLNLRHKTTLIKKFNPYKHIFLIDHRLQLLDHPQLAE
jgi:hypothetical protein